MSHVQGVRATYIGTPTQGLNPLGDHSWPCIFLLKSSPSKSMFTYYVQCVAPVFQQNSHKMNIATYYVCFGGVRSRRFRWKTAFKVKVRILCIKRSAAFLLQNSHKNETRHVSCLILGRCHADVVANQPLKSKITSDV